MRPIRLQYQGEDKIMACAHWRTFPPVAAFYDTNPEELRERKVLKDTDYQRFKIWERVCNKRTMDPEACLICPHVRFAEIRRGLPVLVSPDGLIVTPTVDLPTMEVNSRQGTHVATGMTSRPPRPSRNAIRRMPGDENG